MRSLLVLVLSVFYFCGIVCTEVNSMYKAVSQNEAFVAGDQSKNNSIGNANEASEPYVIERKEGKKPTKKSRVISVDPVDPIVKENATMVLVRLEQDSDFEETCLQDKGVENRDVTIEDGKFLRMAQRLCPGDSVSVKESSGKLIYKNTGSIQDKTFCNTCLYPLPGKYNIELQVAKKNYSESTVDYGVYDIGGETLIREGYISARSVASEPIPAEYLYND